MIECILKSVTSFRLKQRLVILLACFIVLTTSLFSFLTYSIFSLEHESRTRLRALGDIIAASVEAALVFDDQEALAGSLSVLKADPTIKQVFILDNTDRVIAYYHHEGMRQVPNDLRQLQKITRTKSRMNLFSLSPEVERPILREGVHLGTIIIEQNEKLIISRIAVTLYIGIVILLFSLLISYLLAERFQRIITKPVTDMAATMRDVSLTKDYTKRVAASDTDEINQLAESFNGMLEEIAHRDNTLQFTSTSVDTASDAIFWITPEARIVNANTAACRSLGYTTEELFQLSIHNIDTRYNEHTAPQYFAQLRKSGSMTYESEHRTKAGRLFPVEVVANHFQFGSEERSCAFVRDITQRKQMEMEIHALNAGLEKRVRERTAELEEAIREQESFSYSVSHDLRAPLRHINSFSAILMEDYGSAIHGEVRNYLDRIIGATRKMANMIDHLLELSRVSRAELTQDSVDLSAEAIGVAVMLQETQPYRNVVFSIEEGLLARGDRQLLRQLLANLLGNAWKYTSERSSAHIEFGKIAEEGRETFFVKDNGAGFDMAYASKLFKIFQRLHGAEFEGTGIGLATVHRIIMRHNGLIWADSAVNEGATFYFTLSS